MSKFAVGFSLILIGGIVAICLTLGMNMYTPDKLMSTLDARWEYLGKHYILYGGSILTILLGMLLMKLDER